MGGQFFHFFSHRISPLSYTSREAIAWSIPVTVLTAAWIIRIATSPRRNILGRNRLHKTVASIIEAPARSSHFSLRVFNQWYHLSLDVLLPTRYDDIFVRWCVLRSRDCSELGYNIY